MNAERPQRIPQGFSLTAPTAGMSDAGAWEAAVDQRKASLVEPTSGQADLIVHLVTTP